MISIQRYQEYEHKYDSDNEDDLKEESFRSDDDRDSDPDYVPDESDSENEDREDRENTERYAILLQHAEYAPQNRINLSLRKISRTKEKEWNKFAGKVQILSMKIMRCSRSSAFKKKQEIRQKFLTQLLLVPEGKSKDCFFMSDEEIGWAMMIVEN